MKNTFKHTLEEIFEISEMVAREYKNENLTETKKAFLISDLLQVSEEYIKNMCKKYLIETESSQLDKEELFVMATSLSLYKALQKYQPTEKKTFFSYWLKAIRNDFNNELEHQATATENFHRKDCCSSDAIIDNDNGTILDYKSNDYNLEKEVCNSMFLESLLQEFEATHKHGTLVRCEAIKGRTEKREARLEILGMDEYTSNARQEVFKVMSQFRKFLKDKNVSYLDLI